MQPKSERLKVVLELAEREEEKVLKELKAAQQSLLAEQQKASQLSAYMGEYQTQLKLAQQGKLNVSSYLNQQNFVAQIRSAIQQQAQRVEQCQDIVDKCLAAWRIAHEKKKGMLEHVQRCRRQEESERERREQKAIDEANQVRSFYRRD